MVPTPIAENAMPMAVDSRSRYQREQRRARHHAVQAHAEPDQHADEDIELPQAGEPAARKNAAPRQVMPAP